MFQLQKFVFLLFAFLFLTACGLKGDLYLPEEQPQVVDSPEVPIAQAEDTGSLSEIGNSEELKDSGAQSEIEATEDSSETTPEAE